MSLENTLVPLRFFTSLGHFICIFLIFSQTEVLTKNATEKTNLLVGVWMSIGLISVEFIGLFTGFTIYHHSSNTVYIILHTIGILLIVLFIALTWTYWIYWFIFLICSLPSGIIEAFQIIKIISFQAGFQTGK
eukprot:35927_1